MEHTAHGTVDRVEGDTVVLDVGGRAVSLPRAWFPADVREGDGFALAVTRDPATQSALAASVAARLAALQGKPAPAPAPGDPIAPAAAPPRKK